MRPGMFWLTIGLAVTALLLPYFLFLGMSMGMGVTSSTCSGSGSVMNCVSSLPDGTQISYTCENGRCDEARREAMLPHLSAYQRAIYVIGPALLILFYPLEVLLIAAIVVIVAYERRWVVRHGSK